VSLLMLVGVVLGIVAWRQWGPLAGVIVGFLFGGGFGWAILGGLLSWIRLGLNPGMRRQTKPFIRAWEAVTAPCGPVTRAASLHLARSLPGIGSGAKQASRPTTGWIPGGSEVARLRWKLPRALTGACQRGRSSPKTGLAPYAGRSRSRHALPARCPLDD
jgi:hypothetical protein